MKKIFFLNIVLFFIVYIYAEENCMINDSFFLDEKVKVDINISVSQALIDINIKIENKSDEIFMLYNKYFRFNRYFYFLDENDNRGFLHRPRIHIEYDWTVDNDSINILEPNEYVQFNTQLNIERNNNSLLISNHERLIEFDNPALLKIIISHDYTPEDISQMQEIHKNAVIIPKFNKDFIIDY